MKHIQFYYVRHGETIFNVKNLSQGSCDSPLTKNGIHQAEKTKEKLSKNNPVTIEYGSLKVKASTASAKSIINAPFFKALSICI